MKKIILINCYFGKFPWYFNLFLKSCSYNITVDFIIFSDNKTAYSLPKNVKIIPFTIEAFNQLATQKLVLGISVKSAYKLCDFKPAYGVIFQEYIKGYDFWGMTDIDIIFGRIREFMTHKLLETYDVISVRNDYPTGSFMLFKNDQTANNLFKKSKDYKKVFLSDTHYCFDECNFKHYFLQEGGDIFDIDCEIETMHHVIKKAQIGGNLKAHFDFLVIEGLPGQLKWEKGFLSFKNEFEVLLHHLILYKTNKYTRKVELKTVPDTFYIDKYLIRQNELTSIKGFFSNLFYNKMLPSFYKLFFKVDYYFSIKFNVHVKNIKSKIFSLNGLQMEILKNSDNENFISVPRSKFKGKIIKSIFDGNCFFIAHSPLTKYCYTEELNQLKQYRLNGNTQTFK
ncbi:MAG: hypothetical protein COZ17_01135 [Flavobacteriaceae bacterium CG_4_10_14_3_um_filter_33_47]|nr:MAG: hypothetical protein COZ17_01135 [Flavobacteriaceae bacterium CG_4_10_14_3_um_filter_33_47]PJB20510.1 MAG: hypothetical protein CO117_00705 [Flavobacteriaceae bacterium CG_4_9_14_3_um_filter_33_16]